MPAIVRAWSSITRGRDPFSDERSSKTKNYNKNKGLLVTETRGITLWLSDVYLVDVPVDAPRASVGELCGKHPSDIPSTSVHRIPLWTPAAVGQDPR